jgi:CubicO group peptidase (beta-lactamase class C family)
MSSTPEAQGIDSNALAQTVQWIRANQIPIHSLFVERNGYTVLDAYFFPFKNNELHNVASVTKSVTSSLIGIAQDKGTLEDLNAPISALLPDETRVLDDPRKGRISLADFLDMTSGFDCDAASGENLLLEMENSADWILFMLNRPLVSEPGSRFQYCGAAFHMVSAVLTRATGLSALELAKSELFRPLGIIRASWPADSQGNSHGFADLELAPPDAAKLGYLWLHRGAWKGRQIIPESYLAQALSTHAEVRPGIAYGYGFWLYPSHVPFDFEANGRGGQRITVVPAENLVTVVTAGGADANAVAPLLAGAVKADSPLPPDPAGDARLSAAVFGAGHAPPHGATPPVPQWAWGISGRAYALGDNPLGIRSLQLSFGTGPEAVLRLQFVDSAPEEHPVGLDDVPRFSPEGRSGHRVALLGQWGPGSFTLNYNEIARIDDYRLDFAPAPGGLSIHVTERTGLVDLRLFAIPS